MCEANSVVYLLVGLPGSGKTTYAKSLEHYGVIRLSVDELMKSRHGRLGKDYPESKHLELLAPVLDEIDNHLVEAIHCGYSIVLDYGLGLRKERDSYKRLVVDHGGSWRLVHFPTDRAELLRRLAVRNEDEDTGLITAEGLAWIAGHSQEPVGEGEEVAPIVFEN